MELTIKSEGLTPPVLTLVIGGKTYTSLCEYPPLDELLHSFTGEALNSCNFLTYRILDPSVRELVAQSLQQLEPKQGKVEMQLEHIQWLGTQPVGVKTLWAECWCVSPDGHGWRQFQTSLKPTAFRKARKLLEDKDLFRFRPVKSFHDHRETVCWEVLNLYGAKDRLPLTRKSKSTGTYP